jgi:uncharacterized protein (DUF58 family)
MTADKPSMLDPSLVRRLGRLRIRALSSHQGRSRGERRSPRQGSSVEFRDFRKYEPGDDVRRVDWSVYARLERLMLRRFVEEEDVGVDILIDQSSSMHFGEPITKFEFALRIAAILAYVATNSSDRVGVSTFDSKTKARTRALRGRGHLHNVIRALGELEDGDAPVSQTDLAAVARSYARESQRRGVVFVISDFLVGGDYKRELRLLTRGRCEVNVVQILAPEEFSPHLLGDQMLVDSESGETCEITVSPRLLEAYRSEFARVTHGLESFCRSNGMRHTLAGSDTPLDQFLAKNLIASRMIG